MSRIIFINKKSFYLLVLLFLHFNVSALPPGDIMLAKNGKAYFVIDIPLDTSETLNFSARELSRYLYQITGATFSIKHNTDLKAAILIKRDQNLDEEEYQIQVQGDKIILSGGSERAVLYAVYDFLQRLGCVWIAPQLDFYLGSSDYVPRNPTLYYNSSNPVREKPRFRYRKIDVEEGRSHNAINLKKIIDWMPKARFNILMVPLDYGGAGMVKWDNWRKQLEPELEKRGLLIEVGGHGYQNFLNAGMEDSTIFRTHPNWFGKDKNCNPSPVEYRVFNTSDSDAVNYLISRVVNYLKSHPEIDIFDFWPPDGAHWADCPEFEKFGLPVDRQAKLVNQVDKAIRKLHMAVRLEMIAYQPVLMPPQEVKLNKNILVDFCPINQSFEKQIYDSSSVNNAEYVNALHDWRQTFSGDIGLYSYFRKYAWHSLPNVIPHYIQHDMKWYLGIPLQGISTYAEPGDWFTYELNHFILGYLGWNPNVNVDSLITRYGLARYGSIWKSVQTSYSTLENIVPVYCSIPYTTPKSEIDIAEAESKIASEITNIKKIKKNIKDKAKSAALSRLLLMLKYVDYDLKIQQQIDGNDSKEEISDTMNELLFFLKANETKGVFISNKQNISKLMKHYHVGAN